MSGEGLGRGVAAFPSGVVWSQNTCPSHHHAYVWAATTVTESTSTTVRFSFRTKATKAVKAKASKAALLVSGAGALMFPDAPTENILKQAPAMRSTVIIRRGASSATFTVTGARYEFSTRNGGASTFGAVLASGWISEETARLRAWFTAR
jgi:hypothetical protein